jgi:hypothetical protein
VLLPASLDRAVALECNTHAGWDREILEEAAARNRVHQEVFRSHGVRKGHIRVVRWAVACDSRYVSFQYENHGVCFISVRQVPIRQ